MKTAPRRFVRTFLLGVITLTFMASPAFAAVQPGFQQKQVVIPQKNIVRPPALLEIKISSVSAPQTWRIGSTLPIKWTWQKTTDSLVKITLRRNGNIERVIAERAPTGATGYGEINWKLPYRIAMGQYVIRVESVTNPSNYAEQAIEAILPTIAVTAPPDSRFAYVPGMQAVVEWRYEGDLDTVDLILVYANSRNCRIAMDFNIPAGRNGFGRSGLNIPANLNTDVQYVIRVQCSQDNQRVYADSAPFRFSAR